MDEIGRTLAGLLLPLLTALSSAAQPAPGSPYDATSLLEVRPAAGNVVGPGADLLPASVLEKIRGVPHVSNAEAYLFIGVRDEARQPPFTVIGGTVPGASFRVNCHNVDAVRIIRGRGLQAQDAGQMTAIVGVRYAQAYAAAGQVPIQPGDLIDLVGPGKDLGGLRPMKEATVRVVGIFSAGFPLGDSQVLLPLDTAQQLFGLEGRISKVVVTLEAPSAREKVSEALFGVLGNDVDVVSPRQGGMR